MESQDRVDVSGPGQTGDMMEAHQEDVITEQGTKTTQDTLTEADTAEEIHFELPSNDILAPPRRHPHMSDTRTSEECLQSIEEAKMRLGNTPVGHVLRSNNLNALAGQLADYHMTRRREIESWESPFSEPTKALEKLGVGKLPEAVEYVEEALTITEEDDFMYGSCFNTLQELYYRMYDSTKKEEYLVTGIKNGEKAVAHADAHKDSITPNLWHFLYARRTDLLAGAWKRRFDAIDAKDNAESDADQQAKKAQWLDNAIHFQGISADASTSTDGIQSWYRFERFCDMLVLRAYIKKDVSNISTLLTALALNRPHSMDEHEDCLQSEQCNYECSLRKSFFNVVALLCRRWAWTREEEHKAELVEFGYRILEWLREKNLGSPRVDRPNNDQEALRAASDFFVGYATDSNRCWAKHVPTLDVGIVLQQELLKPVGSSTLADLEQRVDFLQTMSSLLFKKYSLTKDVSDGRINEKVSLEFARTKELIKIMHEQSSTDIQSTVIDQPFVATYSFLLDSQISCIDDPKVTGLSEHRLCFKDDGLPDPRKWIRERMEDGGAELGAIQGQNDDIFEIIEHWYEGDASVDNK